MSPRFLASLSLVLAALVPACVVHEHDRPREGVVEKEPPPDRQETPTASPGVEHVWIRGHWKNEGHGEYEWVPGHWERRVRPGAEWVHGHWEHRGGGWVWIEGHWS